MSEIKVSIIVPVYNVAQYLRRCLDSCIHQTMEEIEIIVVNDYSPDPLDAEIMREYEARYPDKIRCIWHKENKKLGGARNTGIRYAKGEFIYCLDSDDYIEPTLCEKMHCSIVTAGADMSVCDCEEIEKNKVTTFWESNGDFSSDVLTERIKSLKMHTAWLIMIKKSVVVDNNLFFPEESGFEDAECILWYLAAKKIVRVKEVLYHYVRNDKSLSQTHTIEIYENHMRSLIMILKSDYFQRLAKDVKELIVLYVMPKVIYWINMINMYCNADLKEFCRSLLGIEEAIGFKINTIACDSEITTYVKNIFTFLIKNSNLNDFSCQYSAYCSYQADLCALKLCYNRLLKFEEKKITIWGAGKRGERICAMLKRLGVSAQITDVNGKLYGKMIAYNTVVKPWDELRADTDVVISSVAGHFEEIRDMVLKEFPHMEVINSDELLRWSL